jgi:hypothetical protein
LLKLNAITEGKLHITELTLHSGLSDDVKFVYDSETVSNLFGNKGWWTDSNANITYGNLKLTRKIKLLD